MKKETKMFRNLLLGITISILLAAPALAEEVNPVVGRAGEFVLREADLERLLSYQSPESLQKLQADPAQRDGIVRQLLLTRAVAARSRKEGFDKKPEVKEELSYVIDNYLAGKYLLKVVTADVTVPEEELNKYYAEHEKEFHLPQSARVRHVYFVVSKDAAAEVREKARAKAEAVLKQLKEGADFAAVARVSSEDADSASKGGELGVLSPGKTNSKEFEQAVFALKAGETSPVVETPFGYHIIRVDERTEQRTVAFDEAKDYIRTILKGQFEQKKAREFLDKLAKETGLEVVQSPPVATGESKPQK
jgi:parvulin-like peptidyl-prolyl isomerase